MADIRDTTGSVLSWLSTTRGTQGVLAAGLSVLAAAGATVVLHSADPASADTFLAVVREAQVDLPDGSTHEAVEGERLTKGAVLRTGRDGGAQLTTAGRRVYVGRLSTLAVRDGVRESLSRGSVMVDGRRGSRLTLTTPAGAVFAPGGSVVRVEEGQPLTRVAAYTGTVTLHPVGRASATGIDALHQVKVQPGSLPQRQTPLQLAGPKDPWDPAVAADLVAADHELESLASGLSEQEGAAYLAAAFRTGTVPAEGPARGEEALARLVAQASRLPKDRDVLAEVKADRADLGSWGVVAALVRSRVADVSAVLDAALSPSDNGPGTPTTVNAGPAVNVPDLTPTAAPTAEPGRPTTTPTATPTPTPTRTRQPTSDPGLVQSVVTTVTSLLPHPTPVASHAPVKTSPKPSPTPPCVLGLVLC